MFDGKYKAVTFSYDDGVTQDLRLIEIFNKYGLKATFNLNSALLDTDNHLVIRGKEIAHNKVSADSVRNIYAGHEIAVHTLTHPHLTKLSDTEVIRQVEQDRLNLSRLAGYEVVGMAYPYGTGSTNAHIARLLADNTGVQYARTTTSTHSFAPEQDLFLMGASVYHMDMDKMFALGEEFIRLQSDTPQIFYIWGHSYEFDIDDSWDRFEEFCQLISNRDDIYYGTNKEILLQD